MGRAGLFETTGITYSGATTTLAYDFEGRVTSITRSGKTTNSFTYNGLNARMTKSDSNGSRTMLRDGADVLAPVLKDGSQEYAPGLYQWTSGGGSKPFVTDRLGTVGTITDWTGNSPASKTFDAFGVQQSGGASDLFAFAGAWGYQSDADHGLQQVGHRVYDPDLGRFPTRDPIKDGRNWYGYCENNPLQWVDPEGLDLLNVIAGWGDGLTYGISSKARSLLGGALKIGDPNDLIDENSRDYTIGQSLAMAHGLVTVGGGIARVGGIRGRIAIHPPHHTFPGKGRLPHIQWNIWRKGVPGSGRAFRVPLPSWWRWFD